MTSYVYYIALLASHNSYMLKTTCIVNIFIQGPPGPEGGPGKQGPKGMKVRVSNI